MKVLSYPELRTEKGIRFSAQWLRKLIKQGRFPPPIPIGDASVGFIESEIDDWIRGKIAARNTATETAA
jgi:prophage regulatory protein